MNRIYLSPPHLGVAERELLLDAFDSNWIAPLGPHVDAFEREFCRHVDVPHGVALSSATAALHLAMVLLDVSDGDEVLIPTLTFAATAYAAVYRGARPVFIDSEAATWNIDPALLAEELASCAANGRLPKAVVAVDLYGQCADYDPILGTCRRYDIPVVADAAEALGATYKGRMAGTLGAMGIYSFNGNKIITTSGGGMLVSHNGEWIERARNLACQARDPAPHYQHSQIGYNYRLSNLLAALGRGQLQVLERRVERKRSIRNAYRRRLGDLPGVEFMPEAPYGRTTFWLTCITVDPGLFGATREDIRLALEAQNVESRPIWKPMHMQPVFAECRARGGRVAEGLFERGLCLPSGTALTEQEIVLVCDTIRSVARHGG